MEFHIGKLIEAEVNKQDLTVSQFAALIEKSERTVANIFARPHIKMDTLVKISLVLKCDFLQFYYELEPLKSLRAAEVKEIKEQIEKQKQVNKQLEEKLALLNQKRTSFDGN
jgi:plasmid maintenance system antidote protein VapI